MPDFDDFLGELRSNFRRLANEHASEFSEEAREDAERFVRETREDLERWTRRLAAGELSQADFEFLVEGKKDLAELEALERAGLARIRADRFRDSLVSTVVGTAVDVFGPE